MQYIEQGIKLKLLRLPKDKAEEFCKVLSNRKIIATIIDRKNKDHEPYNIYSGVDSIYFDNIEDMKVGIQLALEYNNITWQRNSFKPLYKGMLKYIESMEKDIKVNACLYDLGKELETFGIEKIGDFFKEKFNKVAKEENYNDSIMLVSILSRENFIDAVDLPNIHMKVVIAIYKANETNNDNKTNYTSIALNKMFEPVLKHIAQYTPHSKWIETDCNTGYESVMQLITTLTTE